MEELTCNLGTFKSGDDSAVRQSKTTLMVLLRQLDIPDLLVQYELERLNSKQVQVVAYINWDSGSPRANARDANRIQQVIGKVQL